VLARAPWMKEFDPLSAVIFHEHADSLPQAAE
jgi:NTE family protein